MGSWQFSAILGNHRLPVGADPIAITVTFIVAWIVLYVVLVRLCNLDKIAWKRVDYIWLALSLVGVYGAVQSVRIDFAKEKLALYQGDADTEWRYLLLEADDLASPTGPLCSMRPKVAKALSSERREEVIDQFKEACASLRSYADMLHRRQRPSEEEFSDFPEPPLPWHAAAEVEWEIDRLGRTWHRVASDSAFVRNLTAVKERSALERYLFELAPFVIAIAIALRLVKTIGEIRLETSPGRRRASQRLKVEVAAPEGPPAVSSEQM